MLKRRRKKKRGGGAISRKGLLHFGGGSYGLAMTGGTIMMERQRSHCWHVRLPTTFAPFNNGEFETLRAARQSAEAWAAQ